ncbi:MAG: hypothetical protein HOM68_08410 [Gemmatimonadetes bacterium]|nr:hypothetical protein [Gemmatimonadota bacterium]MBT4612705.1 hypothetical protein [Gemmatimonadota bacterium]MBT5056546.1 hypothetical protein [Gemmatimonadota bacterium]MBT5589653.1 hypothetical protein [Gemmatimonadota bacterium]MBT5965290.1 hypothetical protein [Gemmatimonadota bacterium]
MNSSIPIWPAGGSRDVFLRLTLGLSSQCRDGEIRCSASGPYQIYVNGVRLGGGTGGALVGYPAWEHTALAGAWDSGEAELVVVAEAGIAANPWFLCEGALFIGGRQEEKIPITSGVDWQARSRRQDPVGGAATFERHMAIDAPVAGDFWEGVAIVSQQQPTQDLVGGTEFPEPPLKLTDVGSVPAQADILAAPAPSQPLGLCKCVHQDALVVGGHGATQIRTSPGQGVQLSFDFGRQISGWPLLKLRGGRGGVIDLALSSRRNTVEHLLRYHCGEGRQDAAGLVLISARYLTLRLTGFDDEDVTVEALQMLERRVAEQVEGQLEIEDDIDAAWVVGGESIKGLRHEVYGHRALPHRYDWLEGWILQSNDLSHTGSARVARQALMGRVPAEPFEPADWAYALALADYQLHADDAETVDAALPHLRSMLEQTQTLLNRLPAGWSEATFAALALASIDATNGLYEHVQSSDDAALMDLTDLRQHCHDRMEACWNEASELYAETAAGNTYRQWTNGLALLALGDTSERAARIEKSMRREGVEPVADLTQAWILAAGLGRAGRHQRMMEHIHNHWLRRLPRDGSTWRDKRAGESGIAPGIDSLCHWFLLGLRSTAPGWTIRELSPPLQHLPRAQARIPLGPDSMLDVGWAPDRDDEDLGVVEVGVDAETEAIATESIAIEATRLTLQIDLEGETHVRLERGGRKRPMITVNDEVVWRNEKIYPNPIVHMIFAEEDHVVVLLERPGKFSIRLE